MVAVSFHPAYLPLVARPTLQWPAIRPRQAGWKVAASVESAIPVHADKHVQHDSLTVSCADLLLWPSVVTAGDPLP